MLWSAESPVSIIGFGLQKFSSAKISPLSFPGDQRNIRWCHPVLNISSAEHPVNRVFRSLKVGSAKNSPVVYPVLSVASTGLSGAFKNCGTHLSYMSSRSAGSFIFRRRSYILAPPHRLTASQLPSTAVGVTPSTGATRSPSLARRSSLPRAPARRAASGVPHSPPPPLLRHRLSSPGIVIWSPAPPLSLLHRGEHNVAGLLKLMKP